jgi:beta-N-acetylhexosaminidase
VRGPGAVLLAAAAAAGAPVPGRAPAATFATPPAALAGRVTMGALYHPPSRAFLDRVRSGRMTGVLLMGHWRSTAQIAAATRQLQQAACRAGEPLLVATDQEGGRVRRLPWAAPSVAPAAIGSPERAEDEAAAAAAALRRAGVDVDLAPVADTPSGHSFLGERAFSRSPAVVGRLATAFVDGLQLSGIAATAKHFPGLGAARTSTDEGPVTVRADAAALRRGLRPFRRAVDAHVRLVMVSSASYPALDRSGLPAVYSRTIVEGLLRGNLGFDGVIVTDALDAPAAARISHPATHAIAAGTDLLLYTSEAASERGWATLVADARKYPRLRGRLAESADRIAALKDWLAGAGGPSC